MRIDFFKIGYTMKFLKKIIVNFGEFLVFYLCVLIISYLASLLPFPYSKLRDYVLALVSFFTLIFFLISRFFLELKAYRSKLDLESSLKFYVNGNQIVVGEILMIYINELKGYVIVVYEKRENLKKLSRIWLTEKNDFKLLRDECLKRNINYKDLRGLSAIFS